MFICKHVKCKMQLITTLANVSSVSWVESGVYTLHSIIDFNISHEWRNNVVWWWTVMTVRIQSHAVLLLQTTVNCHMCDNLIILTFTQLISKPHSVKVTIWFDQYKNHSLVNVLKNGQTCKWTHFLFNIFVHKDCN